VITTRRQLGRLRGRHAGGRERIARSSIGAASAVPPSAAQLGKNRCH
jgi:hypothetical protein